MARPPVSRSGLAKAGLVLPGLGHLLCGDLLDGLGHLGLTKLVLWAVIAGFPRLGNLLRAPSDPEFQIHPWLAMLVWAGAAFLLWRSAWRYAMPRAVSDDEHHSFTAVVIRQFVKNRNGVLGLYLVLYMLLLALLAPLIAPFDPNILDVGEQLAAPSLGHLMGTDEFRRDLFSRVLYGSRISLSIGFVAVSLAVTIGTFIGATTGYFMGIYDRIVMWFTDLLLALPRLLLLLAVVGLFRTVGAQSIFLLVTILGLTGWMGVARIVRAQVLSLKEQDFVAAGRALGLPAGRIILRHIIPNAIAPVIVYATLAIGGTIMTEAALSFLGLGVSPPTATWGSLVHDGEEYLRSAWWYTLFPGLMIVFAVMSFNLLGDGLRDALDPKLRGRE